MPYKWTDAARIDTISQMWRALECDVFFMDWKTHDKVFSYTSHLPHLLAYTLVECLGEHKLREDFFRYAASGFRDFTRIAASDERMWTDIFSVNNEKLALSLADFQRALADLRKDVQTDNKESLLLRLRKSRAYRHSFDENKGPVTTKKEYDYIGSPCSALQGEIGVAADKSISHRAVMLGAIAKGITQVHNFLSASDTLATLRCLRAMKVNIKRNGDSLTIKGKGLNGLEKPAHFLDCGNAGTAARLLCGLLSGQQFTSQLQGDPSLSARPMKRVISPLKQMGAGIYAHNQDNLPVLIFGNPELNAIEYRMPIASAQIKSAILLASLYAQGETAIMESTPTRDHTERMLKNFGYRIKTSSDTLFIKGKERLHGAEIRIPGDISSAAFFMVAASIRPDSRILLKNVGVNAKRLGIVHILKQMGADIHLHGTRQYGNEPVADIEVKSAPLKGISVPPEQVPLAIDELPVLMVAAACAQGTTRFTNAQELRVKESDRIGAMVDGLRQLGIQAQGTEDGALINGGTLKGGTVHSRDDHRIAMSFAVAACCAQEEIRIKRCSQVATSFPNFIESAQSLGMSLREVDG